MEYKNNDIIGIIDNANNDENNSNEINGFIDLGEYLVNQDIKVIKNKNIGYQSTITFFKINDITNLLINEKLGIKIDNIIVKKEYKKVNNKMVNELGGMEGQMSREVTSLLKLYKKQHFPTILSVNTKNKYIYMSYCGIPLNNDNIPSDWKIQILRIIKIMKTCNISNNDMWKNNFIVKDNIIHLVDFGWAINHHFYPYINITECDIDNFNNIIVNL